MNEILHPIRNYGFKYLSMLLSSLTSASKLISWCMVLCIMSVTHNSTRTNAYPGNAIGGALNDHLTESLPFKKDKHPRCLHSKTSFNGLLLEKVAYNCLLKFYETYFKRCFSQIVNEIMFVATRGKTNILIYFFRFVFVIRSGFTWVAYPYFPGKLWQ